MKKNLIIGLCLVMSLMVGCGKQSIVDNITDKKEEVQATGDNYHMEDTEEYQYGYQEGYEAARNEFLTIVEQAENEFMTMLDEIENGTYVESNGAFSMWDELESAIATDYNNIMLGANKNTNATGDNDILSENKAIEIENNIEAYYQFLGKDGRTEPKTEEELIDMVKQTKFYQSEYHLNAGITRVIPDVKYELLEDSVAGHNLTVIAKGTDKNYGNTYTIRFGIYLDEISTIIVDGVICNGKTPQLEEQLEILQYLLP